MAKFQKGQTGNPAGRPKAWRSCQKLRDLIGSHADSLVSKLLLAAVNDGDTQAAKLLIDRAIPPLRAVELPTPIAIPPDGSLAEQGRAVMLALSRGKLPASQAGALLQGLATLGRLFEVDEILERLGRAEAEIASIQRQPLPQLPAPDSAIAENPPPEPSLQLQTEPAPDSPRVVIELDLGETLSDAAAALGLSLAELHRQIAGGRIELRNPNP